MDGDTFYAQTDNGEEKIRVIGINTPEIGYEGEPDECYAQSAKNKAIEILKDKKVWLSFDSDCYDVHGRTLAYVHRGLGSQNFFERVMLRGGFAWAYPFDGTDTFSDTFSQDEQQASDSTIGGWAECGW